MIISGRATTQGTQTYRARRTAVAFNALGDTGLVVSQAGFGGYRLSADSDAHRAALTHALQNGVNLIDTSSNYADGGSERLVGEVIGKLVIGEALAREEIVVVSKAGCLQGENYLLAAQQKRG